MDDYNEKLLAKIESIDSTVQVINARTQNMNEDLRYLRNRIDSLEHRVSKLEGMVKTTNNISLIVKYIIVPLIIILGGLVGVKIAIP